MYVHMQGARVASAMAAANPDRALACILFSYPLHTPGNQVAQYGVVVICYHLCKKMLRSGNLMLRYLAGQVERFSFGRPRSPNLVCAWQ